MYIRVNIKNWTALRSRNYILSAFGLMITLLGCSRDKNLEMFAGKEGEGWDIIYIKNKYRKDPMQGYFIQPDGKYYAYHHYYGKDRTPFDEDLYDTSTPPTVEANLRKWYITEDSLILGTRRFKIEYLHQDTISLFTGIDSNPVIKLGRKK